MVVSNRARSRRRQGRQPQRPTVACGPAALLLLGAVVLAAAPLLGQAFQLPWGKQGAPGRLQQQTWDSGSTGMQQHHQQQQSRRVSPVVLFAKPKKGPKGLDAAKAAGD